MFVFHSRGLGVFRNLLFQKFRKLCFFFKSKFFFANLKFVRRHYDVSKFFCLEATITKPTIFVNKWFLFVNYYTDHTLSYTLRSNARSSEQMFPEALIISSSCFFCRLVVEKLVFKHCWHGDFSIHINQKNILSSAQRWSRKKLLKVSDNN